MTRKQNKTAKIYDTDTEIMKIIAAFFVVMIHASGTQSFSAVFFNASARFSVPVFVIISGYYMLNRNPGGRYLLKKSTGLFAAMIIWSGIYCLYSLLCGEFQFTTIPGLLRYLLTEPYHLWYIYAAITLYLLTPLLSVFHRNAGKNEYVYALSLSFFFGSLVLILLRSECIPLLSVIIEKMKMPYTLGFVFLYLWGGYLQKYGIRRKAHRYLLYLTGLAGAAVTIIGTWLLPDFGLPQDLLLSFFAPNTIIAGAAFFVFVQQLYRSYPVKSARMRAGIHELAACTMGIYFLHPLILMILERSAEPYFVPDSLGLLILLRTWIAVLLSAGIVFAARRIPVLKRIF